jgi:hypothetical protein
MLITSGTQLLRMEPDGSLITHAELGQLADYNWNEVVVDSRGNAYANNINFNFATEEPRRGIIALVTPDGSARQVADGIGFPNGMVVTPDDSTLIVAESMAGRLTAFDIDADGSLSNRRVWAEGVWPDGICLDAEGAVWVACPLTGRVLRVQDGRFWSYLCGEPSCCPAEVPMSLTQRCSAASPQARRGDDRGDPPPRVDEPIQPIVCAAGDYDLERVMREERGSKAVSGGEEAILRAAESMAKTGDVPRAISFLESALTLGNTSGPLYLALANFYRDEGNIQKANQLESKGRALVKQ